MSDFWQLLAAVAAILLAARVGAGWIRAARLVDDTAPKPGEGGHDSDESWFLDLFADHFALWEQELVAKRRGEWSTAHWLDDCDFATPGGDR